MAINVDFRWINQGFDTKAGLLAALTGIGNAGKAGFAVEGGIITFAANLGGEVQSFSNVDAILVSLQNQINELRASTQAANFIFWVPGVAYVQGDIRAYLSGGYLLVYRCIENDPGDPEDTAPRAEYWGDYIAINDGAVGQVLEWLNKNKANAF